MGLNSVLAQARLAADPELKYTSGGTAYCKLRLAIDQGYGKRKGTCWIEGTCWGKNAEIATEYLKKGSQVIVDGELRLEEWEKDGQKQRRHGINVNRVHFVGKREQTKGEAHEGPPGEGDSSFDPNDLD